MLPLDKLTDKALEILEKNGLSEADISVCLSLDLSGFFIWYLMPCLLGILMRQVKTLTDTQEPHPV